MTQPYAHFPRSAAASSTSPIPGTPVTVKRTIPRARRGAGGGGGRVESPQDGRATCGTGDAGLLGSNWPTLAGAMRRYEQNTAEVFTRAAYDCVMSGLIRLDDRRRLAQRAEELKIKAFDAQLLIACAIRQWALDHSYNPAPTPSAPKLSAEYRGWRKGWIRFAIFTGTAVAIDFILLWFWLGR